ncbi:hypothetical protein AB0C38_02395 [Amycolatopsis sp. NPDC048633]|uniref:hypothetical protein n=1 Tax=Amycolatopsis sp. NPDC048633 TaxID=3157095 RepID=UPI003404D4FC
MKPENRVRVELPLYDPPETVRAFAGYVTLLGPVVIGLAGLLLWRRSHDPVAWWVASALALVGLTLCFSRPLLAARIRRDGGLGTVTAHFGSDGFGQALTDGRLLVLPWDEVREVVFDEGQPGERVFVSVALIDDASVQHLADAFHRKSKYGHVLSAVLPQAGAEKAAAAIDAVRPGLVRWPDREIRRGGLGVVRPVKRLILRWGARAKSETATAVHAGHATAGRAFFLWTAWVVVILDFGAPVFFDIPPGIPLPVAIVVWVSLYLTRYRGEDGEFVLTADSLTWRLRGGRPVVIERADLARLVVSPAGARATRRYVALHAISIGGDEQLVVAKMSPGAAALLVRETGAPPTPITRGAT